MTLTEKKNAGGSGGNSTAESFFSRWRVGCLAGRQPSQLHPRGPGKGRGPSRGTRGSSHLHLRWEVSILDYPERRQDVTPSLGGLQLHPVSQTKAQTYSTPAPLIPWLLSSSDTASCPFSCSTGTSARTRVGSTGWQVTELQDGPWDAPPDPIVFNVSTYSESLLGWCRGSACLTSCQAWVMRSFEGQRRRERVGGVGGPLWGMGLLGEWSLKSVKGASPEDAATYWLCDLEQDT